MRAISDDSQYKPIKNEHYRQRREFTPRLRHKDLARGKKKPSITRKREEKNKPSKTHHLLRHQIRSFEQSEEEEKKSRETIHPSLFRKTNTYPTCRIVLLLPSQYYRFHGSFLHHVERLLAGFRHRRPCRLRQFYEKEQIASILSWICRQFCLAKWDESWGAGQISLEREKTKISCV